MQVKLTKDRLTRENIYSCLKFSHRRWGFIEKENENLKRPLYLWDYTSFEQRMINFGEEAKQKESECGLLRIQNCKTLTRICIIDNGYLVSFVVKIQVILF